MDGNLCGVVAYVEGQNVYAVECDSLMSGSEVEVTLDGDYLTLCEVEILCKYFFVDLIRVLFSL